MDDDATGISGVDELEEIAHLVPEMDQGEWYWNLSGPRDGRFALIMRGREDSSYGMYPTEEDALDLLAACVSEGSHNFYRGPSYVVDSEDQSVLVVDGVSRHGFVTQRR